MTWKEFKTLMAERGVQDNWELDYIDVDGQLNNPKRIKTTKETHSDGSVSVSVY